MKRLIISIATLFFAICASNAQKLHFICFADTNDPTIGPGVRQNVNLMTCFAMQLAVGLEMENDIESIVMQGNDCSNGNLHSVINGFQCSSEDIVIFSYLGHGGRGINDPSDFPQMCLGSNKQSDFVPLEYVKDALTKKGPKFLIVLGDCCNSYSEYIMPKTNTLVAAGPTIMSLRTSNALKQMFMDKHGSVISSGCKKGEYSWVSSGEGGFFTNGFLKGLDEYVNASSRASYTWEELLTNVRNWVVNYSRIALANEGGYIQTPIFAVDHNPNPKGGSNPDSGRSTDLRTALISICSNGTSASERLNRSEKVLYSYFASEESVIDVVGLDQRTIVDHTSASDYLLRLATVEHLANFNIVEQQKNPFGKITYLKIHEIYREY